MEREDAFLADIVATYLYRQRRKVSDASVGPMAINLLVALERYRVSRDMDALASALEIPEDTLMIYAAIHEERKAREWK